MLLLCNNAYMLSEGISFIDTRGKSDSMFLAGHQVVKHGNLCTAELMPWSCYHQTEMD